IGLVFGIAYAVTLFSVPFFIWYGGVQAPTAPPSIEYLLPLANHRSLRSSLPEVLDISTVLSHSLPIMMLISVVFGLTGSVAGLFSAFLQTVEVDQIIKPGELIRGEAPLNREGLTPTFNQQ
ncbi:MAG: hypothetical protein KC449_26445, partial [Anaerolineales bacterium]|nr:hypothetical protein [Anaerolineales bacterium]